jgi:hypothetical protein
MKDENPWKKKGSCLEGGSSKLEDRRVEEGSYRTAKRKEKGEE